MSLHPDTLPPPGDDLDEDLDLAAAVAQAREELALTRSEIEQGIERAAVWWGSARERLSGGG